MTTGLKKIKSSVVVITGASSGIGRASALRFAKKGANVVLAARREEALHDVAAECERLGAQTLVVALDVTDAAVSLFGTISEVPLDDFKRVLDTNVMGNVHGARAALRQFRAQKRGVLINVSSVVGAVPQPFTAAYSMSKAAISALSASIRAELRLEKLRHVHVVPVMPATVDTPIFDEVANYSGRRVLAMSPVYAPQRVARAIVDSARQPEAEVPVGKAARAMLKQHRAAPQSAEKLMAKMVDEKHLSRHESASTTSGNLFEPAALETARVEGGWGGRRHQAGRRAMTGALLVGAAIAAPAVMRARGR